MANNTGKFGFKYVGNLLGTGPVTIKCVIPTSESGASYNGDAVYFTGTMSAAADGKYYPQVKVATNAVLIGGVIRNHVVTKATDAIYGTAATQRLVEVEISPYALFEIREDENIGVAGCGGSYDLSASTSGSTITGLSGMALDSSTSNPASADNQLRVIDTVRDDDNDPTAATARWIVMINDHQLTGQTIGF